MSDQRLRIIGPLAYQGKEGCQSAMCRCFPVQQDDGTTKYICAGWHCSYCDEPTSYQGHGCDAANAILKAAAETEREGREDTA